MEKFYAKCKKNDNSKNQMLFLEKEIENFGIKLSDDSLSKLIKHQKGFKRENEFSRIEYEKFLLKNNMTAAEFEFIFSKQLKLSISFIDVINGTNVYSNLSVK